MSEAGFEPFADFWDREVGEYGDYFHNHFVYPSLFKVLGDIENSAVVDLGSGNGASSRALARAGARVTGVEVSPTLVDRARGWEKQNPLGIEYVVSNAAAIPALDDASFDLAVANMVLMDVEDAAGLIREVGRLLKPGGRFVATLFHPCFEIMEGSSWLIEKIELETYRSKRIWRYREPFAVEGVAKPGQPELQMNYHRPLGWYTEQLAGAGLLIDTIDEPLPDDVYAADSPDFYEMQSCVPSLMTLGARKIGP